MPRRRGRPRKEEAELTVVGTDLISFALPGQSSGKFEMLSPDQLLTRKGFQVYREMGADDVIKSSLWFKKALITSRPWDIAPASDSEADKEAAKFIHDEFERVNIHQVLWSMLTAFDFGFSYGEIIWEIQDDLNLHLDHVAFRDPETIFILADKHGNIDGFRQKTIFQGLDDDIIISKEKSLHYAYQKEFSNHNGVSDLRAAYRAWWSKKYVTQFWNVFLERFGSPMTKMTYPAGSPEELKTTLKSIMENLSTKGSILVPEGVAIELIEATRGGNAGYEEALLYYDLRIATALLVPALLGFGADVKRGSDSQSRLHLRTLMKVVDKVGKDLAAEINRKIINPIVDFNFNAKPPKFVFNDYGEFEAFEITDAIKDLHTAGILELDGIDTNNVRSLLNMAVRDDGEEDKVDRPELAPLGGGGAGLSGPGELQDNKRAEKSNAERKTDRKTGQRRS
jgi:phage gp29-like protein